MSFKLILLLLTPIIISQSCQRKGKDLINQNYTEYNNYIPPKRDCHCEDSIINYHTINIYLEHENSKINLGDYLIIVLIDGEIYRGKYISPISVNRFCFCNQGKYVDDDMISIWAIDSLSNKVYIWSNKETYNVRKLNKLKIKLLSNGLFDIKLDDNWFYNK